MRQNFSKMATSYKTLKKTPRPTETPPFTLKELKACVPAHCFERSTSKSFFYLAVNSLAAWILYVLSSYIDHPYVPTFASYLLWPIYWICQGCVCTGLWVLAHECGHYAFSDSKTVCDVVGLVLHSALLVPYHSWRISHPSTTEARMTSTLTKFMSQEPELKEVRKTLKHHPFLLHFLTS